MQTNMSLMGLIEENDDLDPTKLNKTPLQVFFVFFLSETEYIPSRTIIQP